MFGFLKKTVKSIKEKLVGKDEEELKLELIELGFSFDLAERLVNELKEKNLKINELLKEYIADESKKIEELLNPNKKPYVIVVLGLNGSGKTTFIHKLAFLLNKKGKKVLVVASDTFRAAAIEQLEELVNRVNIPLFKGNYGQDPAAVAFDGVEKAKKEGFDYVIIDTAGRMHSNKRLLEELKKIIRVAKADLNLLVVDATIGQDLEEQLKAFSGLFDEIVVNKVDIDEKGSIFFIAKQFDKPIIFLGMGQNKEDLKIYEKEEILKEFAV
jgi:fused signal recognition particle receptor